MEYILPIKLGSGFLVMTGSFMISSVFLILLGIIRIIVTLFSSEEEKKPVEKYKKPKYNDYDFYGLKKTEEKKEEKAEETKVKEQNKDTTFNRKGWSKNGVNKQTLTRRDKDGYDKHGFDKLGFDRQGYHKTTGKIVNPEGLTKEECVKKGLYKPKEVETRKVVEPEEKETNYGPGYDKYGFDKNGIHKVTGTEYDEKGFNKKGLHKSYYENI